MTMVKFLPGNPAVIVTNQQLLKNGNYKILFEGSLTDLQVDVQINHPSFKDGMIEGLYIIIAEK